MAWGLGGIGSSVCIDRYDDIVDKFVDMDCDEYGSPKMVLQYSIYMWFKDSTIEEEWWVDDLGNIWFEFETRGEAMLFVLEFL